jgi:quercetin dioxygenase-like cupin family protein
VRSVVVALVLVTAAAVPTPVPLPVLPDQFRWIRPPGVEGVEGAWLVGAESGPGLYVLRVRLRAGARMPPHTHPDARHTTVLSGTLHVGFGDSVDEAAAVAVPTGAVYVAPAGVAHWVWAKDGDVEYQESGVGPTATVPIKR